DGALGLVGGLAEARLLCGQKLRDVRQQPADLAILPAEVFLVDAREIVFARGAPDRRERLCGQRGRIGHATLRRLISNRINAAAAATFSDSTPSVSGTVTSMRSLRERPCASLPSTIMPADSIDASASGAGILYAVEDQQRPARIARGPNRIGGHALA